MNVLTIGEAMATTTLVNIRMDTELKHEMEKTCRELGMTMTTAFTIFARKVTREQRIPFKVKLDPFFSPENMEHLRRVKAEADAGINMAFHELIDV